MGIGTPLINGLATAGDVISGYQLPGNNDQIARIVSYRISDGKVGATQFITRDEESSGITDVTAMLRKGSSDKNSYYVFDAQVHATPAAHGLTCGATPPQSPHWRQRSKADRLT